MDRWNDELMHHGVLGMKWGVRNAETKARYSRDERRSITKRDKTLSKAVKVQDKITKLGKKIQNKRLRIEKHPHTPAVTFDTANGLTLVFGARAHAIKKMKLDEMRITYKHKYEKLDEKHRKILNKLQDLDEMYEDIPWDPNRPGSKARHTKYPLHKGNENDKLWEKMSKGQWDKI